MPNQPNMESTQDLSKTNESDSKPKAASGGKSVQKKEESQLKVKYNKLKKKYRLLREEYSKVLESWEFGAKNMKSLLEERK